MQLKNFSHNLFLFIRFILHLKCLYGVCEKMMLTKITYHQCYENEFS